MFYVKYADIYWAGPSRRKITRKRRMVTLVNYLLIKIK